MGFDLLITEKDSSTIQIKAWIAVPIRVTSSNITTSAFYLFNWKEKKPTKTKILRLN